MADCLENTYKIISMISEDQRAYIENVRNWFKASNMGGLGRIIYSGHLIPEYEKINKLASEKVAEEHRRLNRNMGIPAPDSSFYGD